MAAVKRSAGLVVMRQFDGEWHCLVLHAYRNWDFPKGQPNPGEELLQAALRETTEETGLSELELPWGEDYRETVPYSKGKVARLYLALSSQGDVSLPVSAELGRPEHHEFRWVPVDRARELLPPRFWPILQWAQEVVAKSGD